MRPYGAEPTLSFGRMPLHANSNHPAHNYNVNISIAHLTASRLRQINPTGRILLNPSGKSLL
jgi:hypothetical protein